MAVPMYSETEAECRRLRSALRACEVLINKEGEENDATLRAMELMDAANATLVEQREEARAQAVRYRTTLEIITALHSCGAPNEAFKLAQAIAQEALADV